ncbi:MAG: hypothetical protein KHY76_02520 [Butyricicoccus pullicaecorum]|nr:hypothetical protein [Butyricicoccus pullicaecorum]
MIGIPSTNCYGAACARLYPTRISAAARTGSVPPVMPVPSVSAAGRDTNNMEVVVPRVHGTALPPIREGVDPVEMAVRGRIQYPDDSMGKEEMTGTAAKVDEKNSPYETMQEAECQTCKNRKYQDGSNDPSVSFKTATRLTPEQAATAVRGHEMEHVSHERARAEREDRKIVQQSVTIHTGICPECGDVYISGGTTRTTTAKDNSQELAQQARQDMLGRTLDTFA